MLSYIFANHRINADDGPMSKDEFIEKLGHDINQDQIEIIEKIENRPNKPGLYLYDIKGQSFSTKEYEFVSGDDRTISIPDTDIFELSDGKTFYFASEKYKNYFKREVRGKQDQSKPRKYDYEVFFDYDGSLIDGFGIRKEGDNYIVENKASKYVFDKDYVLTESTGSCSGEKCVRRLVKYDEDFDSYYNKYLNLLKTYKEVNDINLVSPKE